MRVVVASGVPLDSDSHVVTYASCLARALVAEGHDVSLVIPRAEGDEVAIASLKEADVAVEPIARDLVASGAMAEDLDSVARLARKSRAEINELRRRCGVFFEALWKRTDPDFVIAINFLLIGSAAVVEATRAKVASILVCHGTDIEHGVSKSEDLLELARYASDGVKCIATPSNVVRARVVNVVGVPAARVRVQAPGVDTAAFWCPLFSERKSNVIVIGEPSVESGAHIAIAAMSRVIDAIPDVKLTFIGDGPDVIALKRLVSAIDNDDDVGIKAAMASLATTPEREALLAPAMHEFFNAGRLAREILIRNTAKRVVFTGPAKESEVSGHMRASRLLVHPTLTPDWLPIHLYQALASGCSIASTRNGGARDLLDWLSTCCPDDANHWSIDSADPVASLAYCITTGVTSWNIAIAGQIAALLAARHQWLSVAQRLLRNAPMRPRSSERRPLPRRARTSVSNLRAGERRKPSGAADH